LSNTNSADNNSNSSYESDGRQLTNSDSIRPSLPHSSHIITRHAPYHHRGCSRRGTGHQRGESLPKKTTGIPPDRLISVHKHIFGALRDQTGTSVISREMA
jgi:hypothetical protein